MMSIITELVHIFVSVPAEALCRMLDTALKTHWWPSAVIYSYLVCAYLARSSCPSDSFHLTSTSFHGPVNKVNFDGQVHISDTISNRSSIFGVWKHCGVYMSNWQVLFNLDLIFMVQWLRICVLVCLSYTVCNRSTI